MWGIVVQMINILPFRAVSLAQSSLMYFEIILYYFLVTQEKK